MFTQLREVQSELEPQMNPTDRVKQRFGVALMSHKFEVQSELSAQAKVDPAALWAVQVPPKQYCEVQSDALAQVPPIP